MVRANMNRLFEIKIVQPAFDELYQKYEKSFPSQDTRNVSKPNDKKEEALLKLDELINQIKILEDQKRSSAEHVRWVAGTRKFLKRIFGEKSEYFSTFESFIWKSRGQHMIGGPSRPNETFNPQLGIDRVNQEGYLKDLEVARGLLLAAKDDLEEMELTDHTAEDKTPIFPKELLGKLPKDVREICEEFNYNLGNKKRWAAMLLLRRLLPLSIVRKFQVMGKESEIINDGSYLDTKDLLGKAEEYSKEKKVYGEVAKYKIFTDSSQHSYTFSPELSDVEGTALKIRLLLGDLFSWKG